MKKNIELDEAAQDLFNLLGGIDKSPPVAANRPSREDLSSLLHAEETRMDELRIQLVEFIYRFAGVFKALKMSGLNPQREGEMAAILDQMGQLGALSIQGKKLLLRFRGGISGSGRQENSGLDYTLSFGPVTVDIPIVKVAANRIGVKASHLPGRLMSAFEFFKSMEIMTCHISLGSWTEEAQERMRRCIQAFAGFTLNHRGMAPSSPEMAAGRPVGVVFDMHQRPDPNLTMLAGVNRLPVHTVQEVADRVSHRLRQADKDSPLQSYAGTYEALFAFKNLKNKLVNPPIEINNVRWLIVDKDEEVISSEKAAVGRMVMDKFNGYPDQAALLMQSIYGRDFPSLNADALDARLGRLNDFIAEMDPHDDARVENEVMENVRERLAEVPEEVFADLRIADSGGQGNKGRVPEKFRGMVSFFKRRFGTRQKMRELMEHPVEFDERDYETIAEDFGIGAGDAQNLVNLLKTCFEENGRFLRFEFEKNIPAFARHEEKVFEFLWHYLKEIQRREDRVAFLNSIQTLIEQMKQRNTALKTILADFIRSPDTVSFADRNALILANLLIRTYNKEVRMEIEMSPEEVLRVRNGLEAEAIAAISMFLEENQDAVFQKIRAMHRSTKEMLNDVDHGARLPIRYLLFLERECYIFFSLVGGPIGHGILRGAVKEYGDPGSEIYHLAKSKRALKGLIQLLRVTIRGLGRFADSEDMALLQQVKAEEEGFTALTKNEGVRYVIQGVMKWIEGAVSLSESAGEAH